MSKFRSRIMVLIAIVMTSGGLVNVRAQDVNPYELVSDTLPIDPQNVQEITLLAPIDADIRDVSTSPDGRLLAIVSQHLDLDYNIRIVDLETGEDIIHIQGRMDSFSELSWSPDSRQVAVISTRTTGGSAEERSVKTYNLSQAANDGRYMMGFADTWYVDYVDEAVAPDSNPIALAWSPTSEMLAIAFYQRVEIYRFGEEAIAMTIPITGLSNVYWSSSGRFIITKGSDGTGIWGIASE